MHQHRDHALLSATALVVALAACAGTDSDAPPADQAPLDAAAALASITPEDLLRHTQVLSADSFEGRAPGTPGEEKTVRYLTEQFQAMGLQPGNPDGTWIQNVPLVGITPAITASVTVKGQRMPLRGPADFMATTRRTVPVVDVENSDLVFVGYGVLAPEYGWDDYKGVDVAGKTIVMLVNDPPIPDPNDPSALDTTMFRGRAMTYYGRWTYKYEIAAEKSAAAAIVVHEEGPAGYPFEVLSGGWGREDFDIATPDSGMSNVPVQAWIPVHTARRLFQAAGLDYDQLKQQAVSRDFRPVPMEAQANIHVENTLREVQSRNVVAKLPGGADADEYVVYTAHWDHLGRNPELAGDQIFNGALDNASGTATLIEIAEAFTKLPQPPDRSVLFLAVTAEERGLLGAKYYAQNPLYPLEKTVANLNMDGVNQWGRTQDIVVIGLGNSTLDDVLTEVATAQGRTIVPDPESEKGFFYRSDHFEFAKQGVPALYADAGTQFVGKPEGYGQQKRDEYTANDYHKVSDEVKPDWDLTGAADDARLLFEVGLRVCQTDAFPEWKPGTEFKAKREQMLGGATTALAAPPRARS
jgi:Zn-dependent M28 family amino/carboxypeptidase